ncbi:carboxymuconolactone decarboxylase family protein [Bradyrhizobium sp. UFLA06-06]
MTPRINLAAPNEGIEATRAADKWAQTKLEPKLIGLVKTRASQINGCTFCLHTHSGEAFKHGETPFPSAFDRWMAGLRLILEPRAGSTS